LDLLDPNFDTHRQAPVWQLSTVFDGMFRDQRHHPVFDPGQKVDVGLRVCAIDLAGSRWNTEDDDAGFFHQTPNLNIVDVAVGVHIAPAQRDIDNGHTYS